MQERLTFRATILIRDEIQAYSPTKADVDYPNKLTRYPPRCLGTRLGTQGPGSTFFGHFSRESGVVSALRTCFSRMHMWFTFDFTQSELI